MRRLEGKQALITGGTSGIGLETARQFLAEGAKVAITGRSEAGLAQANEVLGGRALLLKSDAGCLDDQRALPEQLRSHGWSRLDAAYLNAGDVTHLPLADWSEADFDRVMAVNLKGPFFLLQALSPLLANPSSVILCGSVGAKIGVPSSSAYAASKAGLLSLARTLSAEWLDRGIRVNGLSPGPTHTPAFGKLGMPEDELPALRDRIRKLVPLGRLGRPEELAKAAVFLASDESSYMLGSELLVDGGVGNV
ncbi:SDR family oxidoreductase [Chromobacterium violaceum]|uniref:SDR family oxidoreductase n=1 Tax=Chromobacterium violaceum TaxID=536 RepID=UPI001C8BABBB|nr:SDR family oxidoreductase [Chromobacterium violaceum]MBX9267921.1 SDR family oxidoreductase [Chromobacterium violaceum]